MAAASEGTSSCALTACFPSANCFASRLRITREGVRYKYDPSLRDKARCVGGDCAVEPIATTARVAVSILAVMVQNWSTRGVTLATYSGRTVLYRLVKLLPPARGSGLTPSPFLPSTTHFLPTPRIAQCRWGPPQRSEEGNRRSDDPFRSQIRPFCLAWRGESRDDSRLPPRKVYQNKRQRRHAPLSSGFAGQGSRRCASGAKRGVRAMIEDGFSPLCDALARERSVTP